MDKIQSKPTPPDAEQIRHYQNLRSVAVIDLLGTTESTSRIDISQALQGQDLATIWRFLAHLCVTDRAVYVTGISDSLMLVSQNFVELVRIVMTLFQISVLTRSFRIRAGIEIGNVFAVQDYFRDFNQIRADNNIINMEVPRYFLGDAITGAVLAERKKLKGSRIILGSTAIGGIDRGAFPEVNGLIVRRQDNEYRPAEERAVEIRWVDGDFTRSTFDALNRLEPYAYPNSNMLQHRFTEFLRNPVDDYTKVMVGLGFEWGILTNPR